MTPVLVLLALLLAAAGLVLLLWGRRQRQASGLPAGQVVYSDTGAEQAVAEPLISRRYGLIGRPDYLVETVDAGRRVKVPVEVKSRRAPASPLPGHVLQLATYCLILEDLHGVAPGYGILRYADRSITIPYTPDLRRAVLDTAEKIRTARAAADVARSHDAAERCARCGYRDACGDQWRL